MENCLYSSGKLLQLWWKIVTTVVENCYNCRGKICYIVTNFSNRRVTIFHQMWSLKITSIFWTFLAQSWHFKKDVRKKRKIMENVENCYNCSGKM